MKKYRNKEWLQEKYWEKRLSTCQIGELIGVTRATIRRWMRRCNIPRRTASEAQEGKYVSEGTKQKISRTLQGRKQGLETCRKKSEAMRGRFSGEKHPNWKGGRAYHYDYIRLLMPSHPNADVNGYIPEHRLVMAEWLGRSLESEEVVHHINGIADDNRIKNLMLFSSQAEHRRYHCNLMSIDISGELC